MPALFLLLIATAIRSVTLPGAMEGVRFMLHIDFSAFHTDMLVAAVGQAFFSLSVGMGILITYGSYVGKKENLMKSAVWICVLDTLVAILAAFAIIPAVFVTMGGISYHEEKGCSLAVSAAHDFSRRLFLVAAGVTRIEPALV